MKSEMWVLHPHIWKTESAYMSWIRGGVRRGLWNKHPIKLEFLNECTFLVENTNPRSMKRFPKVKRCKCVMCEQVFSTNDVEVDHIEGNHSLKSSSEIGTFITSIIEVSKEDLQIVCKPCHKIKSYADKQGLSYKQAAATKLAIELVKTKKDKSWLTARGVSPASNQKARREQIIEVLTQESKNG